MDSSLDKVKGALIQSDAPHYFEIRNEDGERYCHCGSMRDVKEMIGMHPTFTYEKIYLPHSPKTVDVPSVRMDPDPELPAQNILPDRQQQPLEL